MGVLNNAQILKKGASFLLEFKTFFPPTACHLFISALWFLCTASCLCHVLAPQLWDTAGCSSPRLCTLHIYTHINPHTHTVWGDKQSLDASLWLLWVEACWMPDAQERLACLPGTQDPQRSAQRKLLSAESHINMPFQKLRPARHRAEPFVSNHKPKVSTSHLPVTARTLTNRHQIGRKV